MQLLGWLATATLVASAAAGSRHRARPAAEAAGLRAAAAAELTAAHWADEARAALQGRIPRDADAGGAGVRNLVMFLGDGMSVPTLAAARTLKGQREGRPGEEAQLYFEGFPTVGLVKTYCVNMQIPDSACTATAYLSGVKNNYGVLGLTGAVPRYDCGASLVAANRLQSIADWALADGRDVGIVTTTRVTHASPAGLYANTANRGWENDAQVLEAGHSTADCPDIAHQLINTAPGNRFKVILGGGRREFIPTTVVDDEGTRGLRTDGRNLIDEWAQDKSARNMSHAYIWNRAQLMELSNSPPEYVLGLFEDTHLPYHLEGDPATEPTLAELTEVAVRMLSRNERGFFLFVEGGRIDHAHHDSYVHLALDETLEFAAAVERGGSLLPEQDSLLVVTADHAHVMAMNGYTRRGGDILGLSDDLDDDGVPFMTLSYTNGAGFRPHVDGRRADFTAEDDFGGLRWRSHSDIHIDQETHGGDDVAVFARGPHHAVFAGLYEQSQLPHLMAYAGCLGPGLHACDVTPRPCGGAPGPAGGALRGALLAAAAAAALALRHVRG